MGIERPALLLTAWLVGIQDVEPVPVTRPTQELGVSVPTVAIVGAPIAGENFAVITDVEDPAVRGGHLGTGVDLFGELFVDGVGPESIASR